MRNTHRCPKCQHDRVLHITQVADRAGDSWAPLTADRPAFDEGHYFPWRIARVWTPDPGFLGSKDGAVGLVEAYVCRKCGFTELYTQGATELEPDGDLIRELRAAEAEGPYR